MSAPIYILFFLASAMFHLGAGEGAIGVCNGRLGNNLPSEQQVVAFCSANGIRRMRIYDPNQETLRALRGSDIDLILGIPNSDLPSLQSSATEWVQNNVISYFPATRIRYLAVGNEVDPDNGDTSRFAPMVLPAMQNLYNSLSSFGLQDKIKVSTATFSSLLANTYPPSLSVFKQQSFMPPIVRFLAQTKAPLLANIYPYFAYIGNPQEITLPYALFEAPGVTVRDGGYEYQNLFDAMLDSMYYATEKAGGLNVPIIVSESGWPSAGGVAASMNNSEVYYRNLINHVQKGTPKRPGVAVETYLFAIFDENEKTGATSEKHFGLFDPDKTIKYKSLHFQ